MLETIVRPIVRYAMTTCPFTMEEVHSLHSIAMGAARKACGLSRCASTGLMMADRDNFGVGFDSIHHTYTVELFKMTMDTLQHEGDIGEMTRGIYTHHKRCTLASPDSTIKEAALRGCPTLRAIVYLENVGVTLGREGGEGDTNTEDDIPELRTAIREVAAQLRQFNRAYASGPGAILQKLGLRNMEDFVSYDGERLLTLPEMRTRHVGKKFGPEQGGSHQGAE